MHTYAAAATNNPISPPYPIQAMPQFLPKYRSARNHAMPENKATIPIPCAQTTGNPMLTSLYSIGRRINATQAPTYKVPNAAARALKQIPINTPRPAARPIAPEYSAIEDTMPGEGSRLPQQNAAKVTVN